MNDERLKNLGDGIYWKELLDRIRHIRSSGKVMYYRQVLDLHATSVDYNPKSSESIAFFKDVYKRQYVWCLYQRENKNRLVPVFLALK